MQAEREHGRSAPRFFTLWHFSYIQLLFRLPFPYFCPDFQPAALGWGFYLLATYETWGERITAYVATVLSFGWMYFEFDGNLQFIFNG